jgi:hypothetical protein
LHLAFYRGWLQGLDLKTLAEQYLESSVDKLVEPGASVYNVSGSVRQAAVIRPPPTSAAIPAKLLL